MKKYASLALLLPVALVACHKEEQAVVGVAQTAVSAEQKAQADAQAKAAERDRLRAQFERIPLPTKSLYVDVHDATAWANPFLSVGADTITLRSTPSDSAHRQEAQLLPTDLAQSLLALSAGAWRYGRVVAVAESPLADPKDRPKVRRNVEIALQKLSDLGIVADEWPTR